jgi:4-aminobutyrate aminotransferase
MNKQEMHAKFGPKLVGPLPGPKSRAAVEADHRLISPSYTRSYPMVAKRGRGVRLEDPDGNEFLDFASGIAVVSTGHCHPEVVAAIQKQAAELIHISGTDFYDEHLTDLAERLSAVAPMPGPHRFFYGNSGAEAIECALKVARYHTGRQQIISFFGAFHGRTMGALSLTGSKPQQKRRFCWRDACALSVRLSRLHRRDRRAGGVQPGLRTVHRGEAVQDDTAGRRSGRDIR